MRPRQSIIVICLFLIFATLIAFWQVQNHDFINLDDPLYVIENSHVQKGLTHEGITWAFTSFHAGFYIPLTWLSFMLDYQLYGLNPGGYHYTNLLFHIANTLLFFLAFTRISGAVWKSAFVAALFALHPLHVESVAWVTERKDVLSAFFWMLTIYLYASYVQHPKLIRYLFVLISFALGLMAKPMLVSLPFILLLLDYWPLNRLHFISVNQKYLQQTNNSNTHPSTPFYLLILEKIPLITLSAIFSFLTLLAHHQGGGLESIDAISLTHRIANAFISYITYIYKMIWPQNLSFFYPHLENSLPLWQLLGSFSLVIFVSVLVTISIRKSPYFFVGWAWYLVTLLPVIGLFQAGLQRMADRFTYIPIIGLFIMVSWGLSASISKWRGKNIIFALCSVVLITIYAIISREQVKTWENDFTISSHALKVTKDNFIAHKTIGGALIRQGKFNEANSHFIEALRIRPGYAEVHNDLGVSLSGQGRYDDAMYNLNRALQIRPNYARAHFNMGVLLVNQNRYMEAITHYSKAIRLKPDFAEAKHNLKNALANSHNNKKTLPSLNE